MMNRRQLFRPLIDLLASNPGTVVPLGGCCLFAAGVLAGFSVGQSAAYDQAVDAGAGAYAQPEGGTATFPEFEFYKPSPFLNVHELQEPVNEATTPTPAPTYFPTPRDAVEDGRPRVR